MRPKLLTADRFVDREAGCSCRYVWSTTEYFRPHYHDYYELFVILDGTATHCINGGHVTLSTGDMAFVRPRDVHDYICENGKKFSMLNMTFTCETAEELFAFLGEGFPSRTLLQAPLPPMVHLSEHELSWFNSRVERIFTLDAEDKVALKTAIRILLFRIFTKFYSEADTDNSSMPPWLDRLLDSMRQNSNYIYGVDRMLALSDKSREHTLRSIKKYTGMTATEYINGLRLSYIANMLLNSNHSISDIIFESGFNNISWASSLFKQKYGMTMTAYRKVK